MNQRKRARAAGISEGVVARGGIGIALGGIGAIGRGLILGSGSVGTVGRSTVGSLTAFGTVRRTFLSSVGCAAIGVRREMLDVSAS